MRDLYDEILDDIEKQEKIKPTQFDVMETNIDFDPRPQSLEELPQYDNNMGEEEFSDYYRTPASVYDGTKHKFSDLPDMGVLAQDITITDNIDEYYEEGKKKHPGIARRIRKIKKSLPYEQDGKKEAYDKKLDKEVAEIGGTATYDPIMDEIVFDKTWLKNASPHDTKTVLLHENIHKSQRNIENAKNQPRVLSEPGIDLFTNMWKDDTVRKDLTNMARGERLPTTKRKRAQEIKSRREYMKEFNEFPFAEQLAYSGEQFYGKAIINPTNKTDRVLKRMWFKDAPIWGMEV